jgi:hypothetical protein
VTHATPSVLRITRLPVGRRASGFVLVAQWQPSAGPRIDRHYGVSQDQSTNFETACHFMGVMRRFGSLRRCRSPPTHRTYHASIVCPELSDLQSGRFDRSAIYLNRPALHDDPERYPGGRLDGRINWVLKLLREVLPQSWDGSFTSLFASVILNVGRP